MSSNTLDLLRSKQFWVFQLLGWSTWVLMLLLRDIIFVPPEYLFSRALVSSVSAVTAMLLTAGLRSLYKLVWERGFIVRFLVAWFGSFGIALIWQPIRNYISFIPFGEVPSLRDMSAEDLFDNLFFSSYPLILLWSGLYFIIKYYQLFQAEKEKSLRSESLAHEAQLLMLRYQLNPHFLFNTLNAISTLVLASANDRANEMLTKLSKFLRYSLDHSPVDKVSLAHELETSKLYLDIEKVRFAERLRIELDIEKKAELAMVPTMLLQPLIENSIKYAVSQSETGGTIRISAQIKAETLVLQVADDGPGVPELNGENDGSVFSQGVGISNIRNRLQGIYSLKHKLKFSNADSGGLIVTVEIPYDRQ
jgi:sensor histidine kinase YesM